MNGIDPSTLNLCGLYAAGAALAVTGIPLLDRLARGGRAGLPIRAASYACACLAGAVLYLLTFQVSWGWLASITAVALLVTVDRTVFPFLRWRLCAALAAIAVLVPVAGGYAGATYLAARRQADTSYLAAASDRAQAGFEAQLSAARPLAGSSTADGPACAAAGFSGCLYLDEGFRVVDAWPASLAPHGFDLTVAATWLEGGSARQAAAGIGVLGGTPYRWAIVSGASGYLAALKPVDAAYVAGLAGSGRALALADASGVVATAGPAGSGAWFRSRAVTDLMKAGPPDRRYLAIDGRPHLLSATRLSGIDGGSYALVTVSRLGI